MPFPDDVPVPLDPFTMDVRISLSDIFNIMAAGELAGVTAVFYIFIFKYFLMHFYG